MDASSSQEKIVDPPRNLFFGVEDRRLGGRGGLADKYLSLEHGRRQKLAQEVIESAMQVANAVKTMRTFDRTGNADQVIDHLEATLTDLVKHTRNLTAEVEKSVDRYGDGLDALAERDAAEATAALNTPAAAAVTPQRPAAAGPKPGPGPVMILEDPIPGGYLNDDHRTQVTANLNRALDRVSR